MEFEKSLKKIFGTDGIRGEFGSPFINRPFFRRLARTIAKFFSIREGEENPLVFFLARDTRESGLELEKGLIEGLTESGAEIIRLGILPTSAIGLFLNRSANKGIGLAITASHNKASENGLKILTSEGKLSLQEESKIERLLQSNLSIPKRTSSIIENYDAAQQWCKFYLKIFRKEKLNLSNLKIGLDCSNGAQSKIAPRVLASYQAKLSLLGREPNGKNINKNCGSNSLDSLIRLVKENSLDIGLAFDGDGDRLIAVDSKGDIFDGDQLLFILIGRMKRLNKFRGGVVGTIVSNLGLEKACKSLLIPFIRVPVGDRNILSELQRRSWFIGGENSGHLINRYYHKFGDGLLSALQVLDEINATGENLSDLLKNFNRIPQESYNYPINQTSPNLSKSTIEQIVEKGRIIAPEARIILRPSGTEPVLRITVEEDNHDLRSLVLQTIIDEISNRK